MDEKKTNEEKKPEDTVDDTDKGDKPETTTLFEKTDAATKRLEEANAKTEELLNRQEELYMKQKLGGGSEAGQNPVKPKEETDEEYTERFSKGEVNPLAEDVK